LTKRPNNCPKILRDATHYNPKLPDPFRFANGRPIKTISDFVCRQRENLELGTKPGKPDAISGSISGSNLTITATVNDTTISFIPTITYPLNGPAPYLAIIAFGSLTILALSGVAIITYNNDEIETLPSTNINLRKIAVTGCSRDGKGALVTGALDSRIRLSDYENHNGTTQTALEIVQENVWFASQFDEFANTTVNTLPFDYYMLAGLVAPRGLLVINNLSYEWLKLQAFVDKFLFDKAANTAFFEPSSNITFDDEQWIGSVFVNSTIRQTLYMSIGGLQIRIRLSNHYFAPRFTNKLLLLVWQCRKCYQSYRSFRANCSSLVLPFCGRSLVASLSERLCHSRMQKNPATKDIGVLNQAASRNRILADGLSPNAISRIDRDAFKQIITRVHTFGIPIFGATITPFSGNVTIQAYSTPERKWIRTSGKFDAVLDFDKVLRSPTNESMLAT
ncbi:unnamed protein product, partial [Aureobasidium pullulans]